MNKVVLVGRLTADPVVAKTSIGGNCCRFAIAANRNYVGSDGERKTDFFNVTAWRGLGETVARYAKKGNKVAVSGSIELHNYEDSQGVKRTAVNIIAQDVEFLSSCDNESTPEEHTKPWVNGGVMPPPSDAKKTAKNA